MTPETFWLPAAKSTVAHDVDTLYMFMLWGSLVLFALIMGAAGYWLHKHRRKPGDEDQLSKPTIHSTALEVFWSVGPLLVCIGLFHWGVLSYMNMRVAPGDSIQVQVRARKWAWEFEYPNGTVLNELYAPVNKPVRLVMNSQDVIHSFYVPDFRIKQDVLPGRYSTVWFQATELGQNQIFCTEYCGLSHSDMLSKVNVVDYEKFIKITTEDPTEKMPLAEVGKTIYEGKACNTCHSVDGSAKTGPTFKGLWGKSETLADGSTVTVDENYIRESILNPNAKIVKGYQPVMPTFQGSLKDRHITGVIEFIKAQK